MLGVTGTLRCVHEEIKNIIEKNYKIDKFSYTPSMYGATNLNKGAEYPPILLENDRES